MPVQEALDKVWSRYWRTKNVRFHAHTRILQVLQYRKLAIAALSILSVMGGIANVVLSHKLATAGLVSQTFQSAFDLWVIFVSIFVCIAALILDDAEANTKAHSLHDNAKRLNELYEEVERLKDCGSATEEKLEDLSRRYHETIQSCPFNHSPLDDISHQLSHPKSYGYWPIFAPALRILHGLRIHSLTLCILVIPIATFIASWLLF